MMLSKRRAPKNDVEKTSEEFADYYSFGINQIEKYHLPVTPTPTHEPAMPAEVFYDRVCNFPDLDTPDQ